MKFLGHVICMQCTDVGLISYVMVLLIVCMLGTWVSCAKMVEPIMMLFGDILLRAHVIGGGHSRFHTFAHFNTPLDDCIVHCSPAQHPLCTAHLPPEG